MPDEPAGYHGAVPARLTLDDLAAIASAPPDATPAELARQLGLGRDLVGWHLRRMRRMGGWFSPLSWRLCWECGLPLGPPGQRRLHPAYARARRARLMRGYLRAARERARTARQRAKPATPPREPSKQHLRPLAAAERRAEVVAAMPAHLARRLGLADERG